LSEGPFEKAFLFRGNASGNTFLLLRHSLLLLSYSFLMSLSASLLREGLPLPGTRFRLFGPSLCSGSFLSGFRVLGGR
jgi:hypothetical protein